MHTIGVAGEPVPGELASRPGCAACGTLRTQPLFQVRGHEYVACPNCGLAHTNPIPSPAELLAHFAADYFEGGAVPGGYDDYAGDEQLHRSNARRRLAHIAARDAAPPGSFLDIGCAYGYALDEARKAGWRVAGVEPSPAAAARARELGLDIFDSVAAARAAQPEGHDVVSMCQVLSHVADPAAAVAGAVASLKPGGMLFIETWRRDALVARVAGSHWHVISPPTVVWLETSTSITRLLQGSGLDVVDARRGHKRVSIGLVAGLLEDGSDRGIGARIARAVARSSARRAVVYALPDLTWVTAVRR